MHDRREHEHRPAQPTHRAQTAVRPLGRPASPLLRLQRTHGNRFVAALAARSVGVEGGPVPPEVEERIHRARAGGRPLDDDVRETMETAFGADFRGVRVHTGAEAAALSHELSARAFTTGSDVFFDEGEYAPSGSAGSQVLAHELAHVVQGGGGAAPVPPHGELVVAAADDYLEREANAAARWASQAIGPSGGGRGVLDVPWHKPSRERDEARLAQSMEGVAGAAPAFSLKPLGGEAMARLIARQPKELTDAKRRRDILNGDENIIPFIPNGICYDAVVYALYLNDRLGFDEVSTSSNQGWLKTLLNFEENGTIWAGGAIPAGSAVGFGRVLGPDAEAWQLALPRFFHAAYSLGDTNVRGIKGGALGNSWTEPRNFTAAAAVTGTPGAYFFEGRAIEVRYIEF